MKIKDSGRFLMAASLATVMLIVSCKKHSGSNPDSGSGNETGTFSVVLNGKSIGGTDKANVAVVIIGADSVSSVSLLSDVFLAMQVPGDSIGFHIPDRTGVTAIGDVNTPYQYYGVLRASEAYFFQPVSVNVTSETSSRIKGTFSGHITTSLLEGMGDQANITDGTFDLPLIRP